MPLKIAIRPVTEADVTTVVGLASTAFGNSGVTRLLFPPEREPDRAKRQADELEWRTGMMRSAIGNPRKRHVVAVQEEAEEEGGTKGKEVIVGWAAWELLEPDSDPAAAGEMSTEEREKREQEKKRDLEERAKALPASLDREGGRTVMRLTREAVERALGKDGTRGMWTLDAIAVDEKQRRRGIGKALVQWGIELAAHSGRDIYLVSIPAGRNLYLSKGFEQIGEFSINGDEQFQMLLKAPST